VYRYETRLGFDSEFVGCGAHDERFAASGGVRFVFALYIRSSPLHLLVLVAYYYFFFLLYRIHAPAPPTSTSDKPSAAGGGEGTSVLGLVPHQLRGYLAEFRNMHIVGAAYDKCTGCSETVSGFFSYIFTTRTASPFFSLSFFPSVFSICRRLTYICL
jgi:hypothetical protein